MEDLVAVKMASVADTALNHHPLYPDGSMEMSLFTPRSECESKSGLVFRYLTLIFVYISTSKLEILEDTAGRAGGEGSLCFVCQSWEWRHRSQIASSSR